MQFTDFFFIPLTLIIGLLYVKQIAADLSAGHQTVLRKLFFFHLVIGVYYAFFLFGDANSYWNVSRTYSFNDFKEGIFDGEGTQFMRAFTFPFSNLLGMSYLANTLFFSLIGFIGMTLFYRVALQTIPFNTKQFGYALFPLIFFIPNLHIWSVSIGKDTLLFFCIGAFTFGLLKPIKRLPLIILAIMLSLAIRPHITLFLFVGFGLAYIMDGKVSTTQRILLSVVLLGAGLAILPSVLEFARIEDASADAFDKFAQEKTGALSRGNVGSSVDISSYPFPLKVLTFWFRPALFDVRNLNGLIAALENLLLLLVFIKAMRTSPIRAFKAAPFVIKGLVIFLVVGTLAFSQSLGNMGIMIRMRNMFLPGMIIYLMWIFSYEQQLLRNRRTTLKK